MTSIKSLRRMCFHDGAISIACPVPRLLGARDVAQVHDVLTDVIKSDFVRENAQNDERADLRSCPEGTCVRMRDPPPTRWETCCSPRCVGR
jgi:hypothetical protein